MEPQGHVFGFAREERDMNKVANPKYIDDVGRSQRSAAYIARAATLHSRRLLRYLPRYPPLRPMSSAAPSGPGSHEVAVSFGKQALDDRRNAASYSFARDLT